MKTQKEKCKLSINQISKQLNINKTTVEHWFRNDNCFSIPDSEIWFNLKTLLKIQDDSFDESITTFILQDGVYDKSNRVYLAEGIMPTLTSTSAEFERILVQDNYFNKYTYKNNKIYKNKGENKLNNEKLKLFDSFSGIGALHKSLTRLNIPLELTGISEIDPDAIISYAAIHDLDTQSIPLLSDEKMKEYLMNRNIGWDFQKQKSSIPRMRKDKLKQLYQASVITNNYGDISIIKPSDIDDFDLFNFSFPCFIAGTLILTDKGYKKIEDIKEGDMVLTHTNIYQKVVKPMVNKANHIYKLKTMCSEDLFVTEEHPFYVRERRRVYNNDMPNIKRGRGYERKFSEPQWIKTKYLSKDYYVGVAINQKSELPKWKGVIVNAPYAARGNKKLLNNIHNYFDNKDFWWIVGRYIGDGWVKNGIDYKGTDIYDLYICCAKNELNEITDVLDKLNEINNDFKYKYYEDKATYRIRISNVEFAKYLQQFGKGAFNKKIIGDVINLPKDLLESFLVGYMSADGCFTNKQFKATSISKELIYGIGQCVGKVYNSPYSIYKTKRNPTCVIEGRTVNQKDTYSIAWKNDIRIQDKAFYENGYIWCPIRGLEKEEYNGLVYNMEVENDNSYTVNNIIVHNCTDISQAGKQEGLGEGTKSGLYKYGIDIIKEKKPSYIMIENVKALITKKFINDFYGIVNELEEIGYNCHYPKNDKGLPKCLNAKDYGIPQNRERIFVICIRKDIDNGLFEFPKPFDSGLRLKDLLETKVDEKYYINDRLIDALNLKGFDESVTGICNNPSSREYQGFKEISPTLCARDYKDPKLVQIPQVEDKYYLSEEAKNFFINNSFNMESKGNGFRFEPHVEKNANIAKTITTRSGCRMDDNFIIEDLDIEDDKFKFDSNNKLIQLGMLDIKGNEKIRRVYGTEGVCPTIDTMQGGNRQPKILEELMLIKCKCNGEFITDSLSTMCPHCNGIQSCEVTYLNQKEIDSDTNKLIQSVTLEGGKWDKINESCRRVYSEEGIAPTIHTCQGGNTEPKVFINNDIIKIGQLNGNNFNQNKVVYDKEGISPTIQGQGHCGNEPKVLIDNEDKIAIDNISNEYQWTKDKCKEFYDENGYLPEMFNPYNKAEIIDISPTQTTHCGTSSSSVLIKNNYRIRKLTPHETIKLMGFSDEDHFKIKSMGISDSQIYKQSGNSIVVDVLIHIFAKLFNVEITN